MKYAYDLHMHSCLSPCGDGQMTPNNLVGLAKLAGLDVIALTDHNTCKNTPAALALGDHFGILVLPGMELNTAEEIHVLCLFEALEDAMAFDAYVETKLVKVKNDVEVFGNQTVMDEDDKTVAEYPWLLTMATDIRIEEVPALVAGYGGVAVPAHVDRDAYSILSVLGAFPPELDFKTIEVTRVGGRDRLAGLAPELSARYGVLENSDAHYMESIPEPLIHMELPNLTRKAVLDAIRFGQITVQS
ncbi:MAG TPA: PHP domain-containing protein [Terriglobales bacterium]|nr:PHP domain-containing protein [Terriglobales bacterium]